MLAKGNPLIDHLPQMPKDFFRIVAMNTAVHEFRALTNFDATPFRHDLPSPLFPGPRLIRESYVAYLSVNSSGLRVRLRAGF